MKGLLKRRETKAWRVVGACIVVITDICGVGCRASGLQETAERKDNQRAKHEHAHTCILKNFLAVHTIT